MARRTISGEPVAERTCKFCNLKEIEDEFHFPLKCILYINNLRSELDQNISFTNTSYLTKDTLFQTLICIYQDKQQSLCSLHLN